MSRIRGKGTKPEMLVRRLIHGMGYRYSLHSTNLPGKPDLAFPRLRKAIFVHGCFWHRHDCGLARLPKSRLDFWLPKLEKNRERDESSRVALSTLGWESLTIWECEIKDREALKGRLEHFLGGER